MRTQKLTYAENPGLSNILSARPEAGKPKYIAVYASPAVSKSAFVIPAFPGSFNSFFSPILFKHKVVCDINSEPDCFYVIKCIVFCPNTIFAVDRVLNVKNRSYRLS